MLQYLLVESKMYSRAELAQMAIEGGCGWLVFPTEGMSDEDVREEAADVVALCKEAEVILTLTDRPALARDLGIHGVLLTEECGLGPATVREELGPEAIIGVEIRDAGTVKSLEAMDIDYAMLSRELDTDECVALMIDAREAGASMPLVMQGANTPAEGAAMMALGANGLLVGSGISDAEDPVEAVRSFLSVD